MILRQQVNELTTGRLCLTPGLSPRAERGKNTVRTKWRGTSGYTLLETVIALALLMMIVVPFLGRLYRNFMLTGIERELTGIWLCEQEAGVITAFPDDAVPVRRRYVNGEEWVIRTEKKGGDVITYTMTAQVQNRQYAVTVFYGKPVGKHE